MLLQDFRQEIREGDGTPLQYSCLENPMDWRSLVGCSPWGRQEMDTTEQLRFHFSLSCIGEGNGNPLQCSCLENPRDGEAWWAAIYGVAQSRTLLKQLSSSSSRQEIRTVFIRVLAVKMERWAQIKEFLIVWRQTDGPWILGSEKREDHE